MALSAAVVALIGAAVGGGLGLWILAATMALMACSHLTVILSVRREHRMRESDNAQS